MDALNQIGAAATIAMGLLGLLLPAQAARFTGLSPVTKAGTSEFRATYGGLWIPLGVMPLASGAPIAFSVAGLCWLGAAIGRIISIGLDDALDKKNVAAVVFETVFAATLLVGAPWSAIADLAS